MMLIFKFFFPLVHYCEFIEHQCFLLSQSRPRYHSLRVGTLASAGNMNLRGGSLAQALERPLLDQRKWVCDSEGGVVE